MQKILKFKGNAADFFFGGCFHHHHSPSWQIPIWKLRGFNSCEELDQHQITKWNSTCDENSTIFLLGDTIFNDGTGARFQIFVKRLRYKELYLMSGNHFSGWIQNYKNLLGISFPDAVTADGNINYEVYPLKDTFDNKSIIYLPNYVEIDINGQQICASHYAIRSWNKMARNSWMLHSHEHLANKSSDLQTINAGKIADLGYETLLKYNDGAPISLDKLRGFMDKKVYRPEGHH